MNKTAKIFAIAIFSLLPAISYAEILPTCSYSSYSIDTQVFTSMACGSISLGNVSYSSIIAIPQETFLGTVSNNAILGNCSYTTWDMSGSTITGMNCPSYRDLTSISNGSSPEEWGEYIRLHLFAGIGFVIISFFPYILVLLALWFGLKYGFYFFDSPKNATKK